MVTELVSNYIQILVHINFSVKYLQLSTEFWVFNLISAYVTIYCLKVN